MNHCPKCGYSEQWENENGCVICQADAVLDAVTPEERLRMLQTLDRELAEGFPS